MEPPAAQQGDVWNVDLEPIKGHEQAGTGRPCIVISIDSFGTGATGLAIVVPMTTKHKSGFEVEIDPSEGGFDEMSYAMPYQVRTISRQRFLGRRGAIRDETLREVIKRVRILIRPPA